MTINGLTLPPPFVTATRLGVFRRKRGSWQLLENADAWGFPLETELSELYEEEKRIVVETERLTINFPPYQIDGNSIFDGYPGFIPYLTDFSQILCFGVSGEDDPFCFDFRTDLQSPEVIWWEDAYWRRVAPDWTSFAALFDLTEQT